MVTPHIRRALLIGAALLGSAGALAQSRPDSTGLPAVLACADIEREILRLECYDEAVAAIRDGAGSPGGAASLGRASEGAAEAPQAVGPASDDASGDAEASRAPPPRVVAERDLEGPASASGSARRDEGNADDGDEADDDEDRQVTIVEVRTSIPGRAVFVTSDGEEFVQTSGRLRLYLPDVPFQANVRAGAVGGTFLTPEGTRRSIRIAERD